MPVLEDFLSTVRELITRDTPENGGETITVTSDRSDFDIEADQWVMESRTIQLVKADDSAPYDYLLVGTVSNNVQDNQGHILTRASHEQYVERIQKGELTPPRLDVQHDCKPFSEPAIHVEYSDDNLIMAWGLSGEAQLQKATQFGDDTGFSVFGDALVYQGDVHSYRLDYVSVCKADTIQNPFARISLIKADKETQMPISKELRNLLGDESANMLDASVAQKNQQATEEGRLRKAETGDGNATANSTPSPAQADVSDNAPSTTIVDNQSEFAQQTPTYEDVVSAVTQAVQPIAEALRGLAGVVTEQGTQVQALAKAVQLEDVPQSGRDWMNQRIAKAMNPFGDGDGSGGENKALVKADDPLANNKPRETDPKSNGNSFFDSLFSEELWQNETNIEESEVL